MNFIVLFGFIYLFGYSIFINTEYISLSIIPVIVYSNLKIYKKTILKDNKGKYGVYSWIIKVYYDTYICSAIDLTKRLRDYFFSYLKKYSIVLCIELY
jgi:hypothetical protein